MTASTPSLAQLLARHTREGELYEKLENGRVRCVACGHRCLIPPGREGICRVRFNEGGVLRVPFGYVAGPAPGPGREEALLPRPARGEGALVRHARLRHALRVLPELAHLAGAARPRGDGAGRGGERRGDRARGEAGRGPHRDLDLQRAAHHQRVGGGGLPPGEGRGAPLLVRLERQRHRGGARVPAARCVSLYKVDLKGFRDRPYRDLGGTLERVLWTIRALHERGIWVEVVTLVVPGFNDSDEELRDIARFLVSVSPDIPWHVTAFHPDYRMDDRAPTSVRSLLRAAEIGAAEGLRFVYAGNLPGVVRSWENTYCPGCRGAPRRAPRLPRPAEPRSARTAAARTAGRRCPACGPESERPRPRRGRGLSGGASP